LRLEDVYLDAAPGVPPMLRCMEVDARIHPTFDEELAMKIEVLVLLVRPQPGRKAAGFMHDDRAVIDIEGRVRAFPDGPAVEGLSVEERGRARGVARLSLCLRERHAAG